MPYSLADLNQMDHDAFVAALGAIFEDTPSVAAQTWWHRPFATVEDLYQQMVAIVSSFSPEQQLALIQAHPDLGSRLQMAEASVQEQAGAGLNQLSADEYDRLFSLNQAYKDKFGFPFIIAVRYHTKASILENFAQRLTHALETERQQALKEIYRIAHLRLVDTVSD